MLEWGIQKLDDLRLNMPNSGGLVIAHSIEMAEYMEDLLQILEGERPFIVHNQIANSDAKIKAFKSSTNRWLVSVGMVSEGVDIPRLRVLVYLPFASTELAFRQAMGRVVRNNGPDDDTRAYVIMPAHRIFDEYAKRVELEMGPKHSADPGATRTKVCPVCSTQCNVSAHACHECDTFMTCISLHIALCATHRANLSSGSAWISAMFWPHIKFYSLCIFIKN